MGMKILRSDMYKLFTVSLYYVPVNITFQVSTYKNKHFLLNERECFN